MPPSADKFTSGIWSRGREPVVSHADVSDMQFFQMNTLKGRDDAAHVTELGSSSTLHSTEVSHCFIWSFKTSPD